MVCGSDLDVLSKRLFKRGVKEVRVRAGVDAYENIKMSAAIAVRYFETSRPSKDQPKGPYDVFSATFHQILVEADASLPDGEIAVIADGQPVVVL